MHRHALTDVQWARLLPLLPSRAQGRKSARGDRLFVDAVIFRAKTGIPWRDVPERFGPWKSVYYRFSNWSAKDAWADIFRDVQIDVDERASIVDASVVRAHQDASGGKGGIQQNALGHSRGGFSTKLHAIVDAKGRPLHVTLTPGERHEMIAAVELLDHAHGEVLIGDTAYDSNDFRAEVKARDIKPVIHSKPERKRALPLDRKAYSRRYLVEVFFHGLKRFRAVATRFEKTRRNYLALVHVACACLWLVTP